MPDEKPVEYPWPAITEITECKDEAVLFHSIRDWLRRFLWFRVEAYYTVLTAWIMATWVYEWDRVSGPVYVIGPINSGKTTVLEICEQLAFRGTRGGSASSAVLFRMSHSQ